MGPAGARVNADQAAGLALAHRLLAEVRAKAASQRARTTPDSELVVEVYVDDQGRAVKRYGDGRAVGAGEAFRHDQIGRVKRRRKRAPGPSAAERRVGGPLGPDAVDVATLAYSLRVEPVATRMTDELEEARRHRRAAREGRRPLPAFPPTIGPGWGQEEDACP
jgi:hypothetical protein